MRFKDAFTNSDNPTNTDPSGFSQKSFQGQIDYIVFTSLINNSSIRDLARITHVIMSELGSGLFPMKIWGCHFRNMNSSHL